MPKIMIFKSDVGNAEHSCKDNEEILFTNV